MSLTAGDIVAAIPEMREWLSDVGINIKSGRYTRYGIQVCSFFDREEEDMARPDIIHIFTKAAVALDELFRLFYVFKSFNTQTSVGFKRRLQAAIDGRDQVDGRNDASRNYFFELNVASIFHDAGFQIDFDQETDVVAKKKSKILKIECKKANSPKKIIGLLKDGSKQLCASVETLTNDTAGLIFLDISNCIFDKLLPHYSEPFTNKYVAVARVKELTDDFLSQYQSEINAVNNSFIDYSLGVVVFVQTQVWIDDVSLETIRRFYVLAGSELSDEKFTYLSTLIGSLSKYR